MRITYGRYFIFHMASLVSVVCKQLGSRFFFSSLNRGIIYICIKYQTTFLSHEEAESKRLVTKSLQGISNESIPLMSVFLNLLEIQLNDDNLISLKMRSFEIRL